MMGADFLLAALGIPKEQIDELKGLLEPAKVKAVLGDLRERFEAMEKRNVETAERVRQIYAMLVSLEQKALAAGPFDDEMNRQTMLFEERKNVRDSDAGNRSEAANGNGGGGFSFG